MIIRAKMWYIRSRCSQKAVVRAIITWIAGMIGVLTAGETCCGTTFSWNNSLGGAFDTASNWTPAGGPPDSSFDTALFDLFAAYEVEFFDDFTNGTLEVVSPGVTLDLFENPMFGDPISHTYSLVATLGTAADVSSLPGSLFPAALTVTGGEVNASGPLYIGWDANSSGQLHLSGGALWDSTGITYVGLNGDGTLIIDTGFDTSKGMDSSAGRIGWGANSSGNVTANRRWTMIGDLTVGGLGDGTMTISSGGGNVSNVVGFIASAAGSTSSVTVSSGGTWINSDTLVVGGGSASAGGDGTLTINSVGAVTATNGIQVWPTGVVSVTNGSLSSDTLTNLGDMTFTSSATVNSVSGVVGDETNSVGNATVQLVNPGTAWAMTGDLRVGGRDTSNLTISLGAVVSNANALVAVDSLASADVTLTMAGAQWTSSGSVYLGGDATTAGGSGTTQVQPDTMMDVAGILKVWDNYTLTIDGTVSTPILDVSGTVDVTGALDLTGSGTIGVLAPSGGIVNADSFDFGDNSLVGFGTLNGVVTVGGDVTATGALTLGDATSFDGVVIRGNLNVGAQSVTINKKGFFSVGTSAVIAGGTLTVSDGATIPVGSGLSARGTINGRIVQQAGSNIEATGDLILGDAASPAGFFSDGEMTVENKNRITLLDANEAVFGGPGV